MRAESGNKSHGMKAQTSRIMWPVRFRRSFLESCREATMADATRNTRATVLILPLHRSGRLRILPLRLSRMNNRKDCTGDKNSNPPQAAPAIAIASAIRPAFPCKASSESMFLFSGISLQDCYTGGGNGGVDGIFNTCSRFIKINTNLTFCNG